MEINKIDIEKEREIIKDLQHQLAEKDKEIDILTVGLQAAHQYSGEIYNKYVKDNKKQLRHEICEKIRKQFDNEYYWCYGDNHNNIVIAQEDFNIILDKIEKGEVK